MTTHWYVPKQKNQFKKSSVDNVFSLGISLKNFYLKNVLVLFLQRVHGNDRPSLDYNLQSADHKTRALTTALI